MALPIFPNPITLLDLDGEFGGPPSPALTDYYAGGTYVPGGAVGFPTGAGPVSIPASGVISLTSFYGAFGGATLIQLTTSGSWEVPPGITSIDAVIVGGGGGGGGVRFNSAEGAGGGGAGGVLYIRSMAVTPGDFLPVTIGAGGAVTGTGQGADGSPTIFNSFQAAGGGGGGGSDFADRIGRTGGSSGGGCGFNGNTGSVPPTPAAAAPPGGTVSQGNTGGVGVVFNYGGGGGGGSRAGQTGPGGRGRSFSVSTTPSPTLITVGGGGGGGNPASVTTPQNTGGLGGGGNGGLPEGSGSPGSINTGGGGGGSGSDNSTGPVGGAGGSGTVWIAYNNTIPPGVPVSSSGFSESGSAFIGSVSVSYTLRASGVSDATNTSQAPGNPADWFSIPAAGTGIRYWAYVTRTGGGGTSPPTPTPPNYGGAWHTGLYNQWVNLEFDLEFTVNAVAFGLVGSFLATSNLTITISDAPGGATFATITASIDAQAEGTA